MKDIAVTELKRKLDLAQKEKDKIQLIVDKLEIASKSLNKLIDCQIVDNCKKGLGYESYNVPVVENKSSEKVTKAVRKNIDAPIIEYWVSDDEKKNVTQPKIVKKNFKPSFAKIEFVKSKEQVKSSKKTIVKQDYEEIDGGYVVFGGNPKGGKITGKGKAKTAQRNTLSG
nr:hypothetical protein [Tanacetum cinerariifolium]